MPERVEQVAVQREHDIRLVEMQHRIEGLPVGEQRAFEDRVARDRRLRVACGMITSSI